MKPYAMSNKVKKITSESAVKISESFQAANSCDCHPQSNADLLPLTFSFHLLYLQKPLLSY